LITKLIFKLVITMNLFLNYSLILIIKILVKKCH